MNITVIDGDVPGTCSECGKKEETRPYGKDGKPVCFDCAMKDEDQTRKMFHRMLSRNDKVVIKGAGKVIEITSP